MSDNFTRATPEQIRQATTPRQRTGTQVDIDTERGVITRQNLATGEVSQTDLAGRPISQPSTQPKTTRRRTSSAGFSPARQEDLDRIDAARDEQQQFTRATPQAIRQATTPRQEREQQFTPATPDALRELDVRAGRGLIVTGARVEPVTIRGVGGKGQRIAAAQFALDVRADSLREVRQRTTVESIDLIATGLGRRGLQVAGLAASLPFVVTRAGRETIRDTFSPAARKIKIDFLTGVSREIKQQGRVFGIATFGLQTAASALVSPITMARDYPGEFVFDVGASTVGVGIATRAIRGTPSGVPRGAVQVTARQPVQRRTGLAPETVMQEVPTVQQPSVRFQFQEGRGLFRTPAETRIDFRPDGTIQRVRDFPGGRTEVTIQQPGAVRAQQIDFSAPRGTPGRTFTRRQVDPIDFRSDLQVIPDAVQIVRPRAAEVIGSNVAVQQAQIASTSFIVGQNIRGTVRTFGTFAERTTIQLRRIEQAVTRVAQAPSQQPVFGVERLGTRFEPQRVRFVDALTEQRPPRLQTRTGEPQLFITETPRGQVIFTEIPSEVITTPELRQTLFGQFTIAGEIRQVEWIERIARQFRRQPTIRKEPQIVARPPQVADAPTLRLPTERGLPRITTTETMPTSFQARPPTRAPRVELQATQVPVQQIQRIRTVQQPSLRVQDPFTIRTPTRVRVAPAVAFATPTQIRQEVGLLTRPDVALDVRTIPIIRQDVTPIQRVDILSQQRQIQQVQQITRPVTGFTPIGARVPGLPRFPLTPIVPIAPPLPPIPGAAPNGGRVARRARVRGRRTRTILQQFLGVTARAGDDRTGLFLRG